MKYANKVIFALITIIAVGFVFNASPTSAAETFSFESFACGEPVISDDLNTEIDKFKEEDANMVESFIASQSQHFFKIGDVNSLGVLVFGNPYCSWNEDKNVKMSSNGVFTDKEMDKIINPLMNIFKGAAILMIILSILISSLKLMATPMRGAALDEFFNSWKMILFVLLLYVSYDWLINLLFEANAAIVLSIKDLIPDANFKAISIAASWKDYSIGLGFAPLMILIAVEWVLSVVVNFIYISRKVIILILMAIGFVAIYSLLFNKTRGFFVTWLKELTGNIFLQSIHAIVLFTIVQFSAAGAGTFFKICLLIMFIPVSGLLSKLLQFGDSATKTGMTMSMLGLGGIMSTYMVASQAGNVLRGGSFLGNSSNTINSDGSVGGSSLSELATNSGSDLMQTALSTAATGQNSPAFSAVKNAMSTMGAATGSVAGMVAGPAGVAVGAGIGKAIGGGIPQIGMNIGTGIAGLSNTISQAKQFASQSGVSLGSLLAGKAGSDFAVASQGRHFAGAIGESVGLMLAGQKGAAIGRNLMSSIGGNTSNLAAMNSASLGLVDSNGKALPMSYDALGKLNPGADMKFVQTNEGSAMYMKGAEGWQQVGLTGSADTSLANGQARVMDFNLADPSKDYQLQANGSYTATAGKDPINAGNSSLSDALGNSVITSSENVGQSPLSEPVGSVASMPTSGLEGSTLSSGAIDTSSPMATTVSGDSPLNTSISGDTTVDTLSPMATSVSGDSSLDTSPIGGTTADTSSPLQTSDSESPVFTSSDSAFENVAGLNELPTISQSTLDTSAVPTTTAEAIPTNVEASPSPSTNDGGSSFERPELAGLPGSTDSLMRTSDAQIVNTGGARFHDVINEVTKDGVTGYKDSAFDPKKFNPETYVYRGPEAVSKDVGNLTARPETKESASWVKQAHRVLGNRHKGVN